MRVKVLFFGMLKDVTGLSEDSLEVAGGASLGSVFDHYAGRFPRLGSLSSQIVLARNQQFASPSDPVSDGDEVALLPPVSGGSGAPEAGGELYVALTRDPIDPRSLEDRVRRPADGAVVVFEGVVRNNTRGRATAFLEYECYEAMALPVMAAIARELAAEFAIGRVAMVHRLGRMDIGEASVVIAVSAPHRRPAFEAALEAINRLKRTVPIWKKEHFADGEVWVEGEWDEKTARASSR
jgi:MoaE-MoaD fusion protein